MWYLSLIAYVGGIVRQQPGNDKPQPLGLVWNQPVVQDKVLFPHCKRPTTRTTPSFAIMCQQCEFGFIGRPVGGHDEHMLPAYTECIPETPRNVMSSMSPPR